MYLQITTGAAPKSVLVYSTLLFDTLAVEGRRRISLRISSVPFINTPTSSPSSAQDYILNSYLISIFTIKLSRRTGERQRYVEREIERERESRE